MHQSSSSLTRGAPNPAGGQDSHGGSSLSHPAPRYQAPGETAGPASEENPPNARLSLQFPTKHLDAPTQPYLTFGLDLNNMVGSDDSYRLFPNRAITSPSPASSPNHYRSRSRSRSPSRGNAIPASPRRNSSPNFPDSFHRVCPPDAGLLHNP